MGPPPGEYDWPCASFVPPKFTTNWQIDRFSHFCTAHARVSSGMPRHVLSSNNCPFAWGIWDPSNTCFLGPTQVDNPNGISISQPFLHRWCRVSLHFTTGRRHLGFLNFWNSNGRNDQDGQTASPCQILWRSVKLWLIYGNFSIFPIWRLSPILVWLYPCLDDPRRAFGGLY